MLLCISCVLDEGHRGHNQMIESIASVRGGLCRRMRKRGRRWGKQRAVFEKMYGRVQEEMNRLEGCYEAGVKCYERRMRG